MRVTVDPSSIYQAAAATGANAQAVTEAVMEALTVIALRARKAEIKNAKTKIDRATPFALKSFVAKKSERVGSDLESSIYVKTAMEDIFRRLEYGGTKENGRSIADTSILNRYGGMNRNQVKSILKRTPNAFYAEINGTKGIWRRDATGQGPAAPAGRRRSNGQGGSRNISLILAFEDRVKYDPQLGYNDVARQAGLTLIDETKKQLRKRMRNAQDRARRAASRAAGGAGPGRRAGT